MYVSLSQFQFDFLRTPQPRKTVVGGRGSGKTYLIGHVLMKAAHEMPGCKIAMAGPDYKQLKEVVLPQCKKAFDQWGVVEYDPKNPCPDLIEYVRYKPDIPAYFDKCFTPPDDYSNCYAFSNGSVIQLLTFVKPEKNRGYDFDVIIIDESAKFKELWLNTILTPCNRGNAGRWTSSMHRGIYDFTSGAWHPEEQWIYKTEELARQFPDKFYFGECTALDNPATGAEYVEAQRLVLDHIEFGIEVMNERMTRRPDGFYPSLNPQVHLLRDNYDHETKSRIDYTPTLPLCVTLDFNVDFTSGAVIQPRHPFHYVVGKLTRKFPRPEYTMSESLALDFCEQYANHVTKIVTVYGDPAGKNRTMQGKIDKKTGTWRNSFDEFCDIMRSQGWVVKRKILTSHPKHIAKQELMNEMLMERKGTFRLRISQRYAYSVYISMQYAPIKENYSKDKVSESKNVSQEFATHLSDTIDYYVMMEYNSTSINRPMTPVKFQ